VIATEEMLRTEYVREPRSDMFLSTRRKAH
jgi:hypothetical protein